LIKENSMLSSEQRTLFTECKEFMTSVPEGSWGGRPEWRSVLLQRIDSTLIADDQQQEMLGGIRGALTRWLSKGKAP
jgi:hypothetical protein